LAISSICFITYQRTDKVKEKNCYKKNVLLFSREKFVKELLSRHVTSDVELTSNEQILVEKYNLPSNLILSTKAQRAEYDKQWTNAVRLWIQAKQWRRAHETYCTNVFHETLLKG